MFSFIYVSNEGGWFCNPKMYKWLKYLIKILDGWDVGCFFQVDNAFDTSYN